MTHTLIQVLHRSVDTFMAAITSLTSSKTHIVAAADSGSIIVFSLPEFEQVASFRGNEMLSVKGVTQIRSSPCSSVVIRDDLVIATFGSGHLRFFSIDRQRHVSCVSLFKFMALIRWV